MVVNNVNRIKETVRIPMWYLSIMVQLVLATHSPASVISGVETDWWRPIAASQAARGWPIYFGFPLSSFYIPSL